MRIVVSTSHLHLVVLFFSVSFMIPGLTTFSADIKFLSILVSRRLMQKKQIFSYAKIHGDAPGICSVEPSLQKLFL